MIEVENRMVVDSEWGETDYGVKTDGNLYWDDLPDECFEEE
jgi:hypothetical protein